MATPPIFNARSTSDQSGYNKDHLNTHGRIDSVASDVAALTKRFNALPKPTSGTTTIVQQVPAPPSSTGLTNVGISLPADTFSWTPATLVNNGSIAVSYLEQTANTFHAGPATGAAAAPTWRSMAAADLPVTAVTPGTYTNTTVTVNQQGQVTAASDHAGITAVIPIAKLTPVTGADGSLTFTNGILTAHTDPT